MYTRDQRDCSAAESTGCSYRGAGFGPSTHTAAHKYLTPVIGDPTLSSDFCGHRHQTHNAHIYTQAKQSYTVKKRTNAHMLVNRQTRYDLSCTVIM